MTMPAWVVEHPAAIERHPLARVELPLPEPGDDEVRLRVLACGVCHTDLHLAEGDLAPRRPRTVPGHQIVGVIDGVGAKVTGWREGDRVGVTWLAGTCGACEHCREGRENLCERAEFTGWDRDGGFAAHATARADFVVPLPGTIEPVDAAPLLCAGVIGWRSLRLAGLAAGKRIGLVGYGASAHLALQLVRARGAEAVVFSRSDEHRRDARAAGAIWAGGLGEPGPSCHGMVLFAPSGKLVPRCLSHLARGGTLAINAVHLSDIPSFPYDALFGERVVRSVSHLTRDDARELVEIAAGGDVRARPTVYRFEDLDEALGAVKEARLTGQAVLAMP